MATYLKKAETTTFSVEPDTRNTGAMKLTIQQKAQIAAMLVCTNYLRVVSQQTAAETENLRDILGERSWKSINDYVRDFAPSEVLKPPATAARKNIYKQWDASSVNCAKLMQFIINHPYALVLPTDLCKGTNGVALAVHPITIKQSSEVSSLQVDAEQVGKISVLVKKVQASSEVRLIAVAEYSWVALTTLASSQKNSCTIS